MKLYVKAVAVEAVTRQPAAKISMVARAGEVTDAHRTAAKTLVRAATKLTKPEKTHSKDYGSARFSSPASLIHHRACFLSCGKAYSVKLDPRP